LARFRGSDDTLDREIRSLEEISRIRLRRAANELREMDRDLRELKTERARRRVAARVPGSAETPVTAGTGAA
jgi:hypothetical protein